jgi:hypothetical protein
LSIRIRREGKDINIRSWRGSRHRNIPLTAREHGAGRYTPTIRIVWPCDLLTVMAKLNLIGNCYLLNWNRNISSLDGHSGIRGRNTRFPDAAPPRFLRRLYFFRTLAPPALYRA